MAFSSIDYAKFIDEGNDKGTKAVEIKAKECEHTFLNTVVKKVTETPYRV